MGWGKKKKRNRKRSESAKLAAKFTEYTHGQWLDNAEHYESKNEDQLSYAKRVADLENSMLARTIFVTGVRDLNQRDNLQLLRIFFEQKYGPVEDCFISSYGSSPRKKNPNSRASSYPPARVRFRNESDYKRVLHETMSLGESKQLLRCPQIGCINGSMIKITKSQKYENMTKGVLEGSVIQFSASGLALGHWLQEDMLETWQRLQDSSFDDMTLLETHELGQSHWLEEVSFLKDFQVQINLSKRYIELEIAIKVKLLLFYIDATEYATFRFKEIDGVIDLCCNDGQYSLMLTLKHPPKLERKIWDPVFEEKKRHRCLTFGDLKGEHCGSCLSLRIALSHSAVNTLLLSKGLEKLKSFGLFAEQLRDERHAIRPCIQRIGFMKDDKNAICAFEKLHKYDARLGFTMRSLLDQSKFCWYHALRETFHGNNIFALTEKYPLSDVYQALDQIMKACGRTRFPCRLFSRIVHGDTEGNALPEHCISIPRVLLTPCRQVCLAFEIEMSNRVVRQFIEEKKFPNTAFLRLHVGDEDGRRIFDMSSSLEERIKQAILTGITINGRRYSFLAYSSSQLKESSVWMVAPEGDVTVDKMRRSMGDFSGCKTPSKYAARIGQCFSTTFQSLGGCDAPTHSNSPLRNESPLRHVEVDDISSIYENVPHSDGNGLICDETMVKLLRSMPNLSTKDRGNISVIQIRYGGAKGILVAWPSIIVHKVAPPPIWTSMSHHTHDVVLRKSMIKFDAPYRFLEICRVGSRVPYYLNRNVILLLAIHGVNDNVFLSLQAEMLHDLNSMLENQTAAIRQLSYLGGADSGQRSRLLHALYAGLSPKTDPFLFACCVAIRSHHLYGLRKKSRIFIEKGAVLIGGLDETRLLPEYCVFLQTPRQPTSLGIGCNDTEFEIIVGPVMVTKHPVMHPGDVRMLLAVDIPELRCHKNVLLFSQKGDRPESNKMSGSDLDGDEYAVTWDPRLFLGEWNNVVRRSDGRYISQRNRVLSSTNIEEDAKVLQNANRQPLDYTAAAVAKPLDKRIDDSGLIQHFLDFARNDCLGAIAMLWQDWAALKGADCTECILLAGLHSTAVDFAKTGIPTTIPSHLRFTERVAHWREKKRAPSRHCSSVVGQMYDKVVLQSKADVVQRFQDGVAGRKVDSYGLVLSSLRSQAESVRCLRRNYQSQIPVKLGWTSENTQEQDDMLSFANEQREAYEDQIMQIMNKYHLRGEGELSTGCIRKYNKLHKKRQHEVSVEVRRQCHEVSDEYRTLFYEEALKLANYRKDYDDINQMLSGLTLLDSTGNDAIDTIHDDTDTEMLPVAEKLSASHDRYAANSMASIIREKARKLAAAYYISTYYPEGRGNQPFVLFSFPWIVANVIAHGVNDTSTEGDEIRHA